MIKWNINYMLQGKTLYTGNYKGFEIQQFVNTNNNKIKKIFILSEFNKKYNSLENLTNCVDYLYDCFKEYNRKE